MPRLIHAILIDDNGANQTTKLDQRVPIAPVARQTRRLDGEHCADTTFTDRGQQPLKARTADARTRAAKIVIDDRHISPTERARTLGQAILATPTLVIVRKLVHGRLPDVDEGATRQMVRRYLHYSPPPRRWPPTSLPGARSPVPEASLVPTLLSAPAAPCTQRGRGGDGPA